MHEDGADRPGGLVGDARELMATAWRVEPRRLVLQVALLLGTGLTGGVSLLLLIPVVNSVAGTSGGMAIELPWLGQGDLSAVPLPFLLLAVVLLVAGQALLVRWSSVNTTLLQQRLVDRMRRDAFDAILAARWSFILDSRRSDITEIATTGANRSGAAFSALLRGAVSAVIALATAVVSAVVAPVLTLLAVGGIVAFTIGLLRSLAPAHRMGQQYGRRNRILQSVMLSSLDSLRLVRAHGASTVWREQLAGAFGDTREIQLANTRRTSTVAAVATIGLAASAALLVLVAVGMDVPATTIVLVLLLAARLSSAVRGVVGSLQAAANTLPAVDDLRDLTFRASEAAEVAGAAADLPPADPDAPTVRLRNVTFRYPSSGAGLDDVSIEVPRGRVTALVGPSGAGKSTTADVILGLLSPDAGNVEVEGSELRPELLASWRSRVAYVPQETVLLSGSVRWNLSWCAGRTEVSDEECWEALDAAAAGFVRGMPDGLDTELGDRGTGLSGGQRQRLAIARALLRRPDVLVLDEATSSLDDATESAVMSVVGGLAPRLTVVVIAHRQSTIEAADHVVELAHGRVVGTQVEHPE